MTSYRVFQNKGTHKKPIPDPPITRGAQNYSPPSKPPTRDTMYSTFEFSLKNINDDVTLKSTTNIILFIVIRRFKFLLDKGPNTNPFLVNYYWIKL